MSSAAMTAPASIQELAERYLAAWNDHDLEAILGLQTPDSEFHLNGAGGLKSWVGIDACREVYGFLLQAWPDQRFEVVELTVHEHGYIGHSRLTGTLALPWPMGDRTYQPTGKPLSFELVDIMECRDNRVRRKRCWIDGIALREQLESAA